jgi:uncharacterized membrane protein (UPF0127 family)
MIAALALSLLVAASPASAKKNAAAPACKPQKAAKTAKLTYPDGTSIVADVVDTPASRETGLMCRTKLKPDYGMLFAFPAEMDLNFWMKNTLVSLDIVWIGADKRVTVVHANMPKSTTSTPDDKVAVAGGRGQWVLELPAGAAAKRGLKPGDLLSFDAAVPEK